MFMFKPATPKFDVLYFKIFFKIIQKLHNKICYQNNMIKYNVLKITKYSI